jgi:G3E family GTPase
MLEVLLVTGPLGSGKTTVVNRLLRAEIEAGRKVAVLINEFGTISVDGLLVAADRPELAGLANLVNGCACCSLRADVVATLAAWCDLDEAHRPGRVVLETTGLADPTDLVDLEAEPSLAGRLRLAGCLTVISALTPMDQLARKPLVRHQAALASLVYVSKADLDPAMAMAWESQIRAAYPGHPVLPSRHGLAAAGSPDPWQGSLPEGPHEATAGPSFAQARALTLHWDHPVDPDQLEALFLRPPARGELLRGKGTCAFHGWPARNDGSDRWSFQLADGRLEIAPLARPAGTEPAPMAAVIIGLDLDWAGWRADLRALERPPQGARHRTSLAGRVGEK